jgi:hypothetical protein
MQYTAANEMSRVAEVKRKTLQEPLNLAFIYHGRIAKRVMRNLINDPSDCKSGARYHFARILK